MKARFSGRTLVRAALAVVLISGVGTGGWFAAKHWHRPATTVEEISLAVPAAAPFFAYRGAGFARSNKGIHSANGSLPGQEPNHTIAVEAPNQANGEFNIEVSANILATVRLLGASARAATVEKSSVVYHSAYPAIDVVAVRDPERFEISYILREARRYLDVALGIGHLNEGSISEDADGSVTIHSASGRPRLRLDRPFAVDARGTTRLAKYHVDGDVVRVSLETADLEPPIVLDPAIYVPFWTELAAMTGQPGAAVYNQAHGSRETQVSVNPKTGRLWLIRPTRSQQREDHGVHFGTLAFPGTLPTVGLNLRQSGSNGPNGFSDLQLADWQRTYFAQSEAWEWSGSRWQLLPQTGLAGLIDPSLAYLPSKQTMVAFGGATPEFYCNSLDSSGADCHALLESLRNSQSVFETDGSNWVRRGLSGAPKPRLRPGMSTFGASVLVFGGRQLETDHDMTVALGDTDDTPPYPDSIAKGLLNDTWLYDGSSWKPVATGNPPPAQEQAKIVNDTRRKRAVLVGGNSVARPELYAPVLGLDPFSLWEFDGTDWLQRFEPGDTRLPGSFQNRRGVAAVWHPVRQTTILFGGLVDVLDSCPYSGAALEQKRTSAVQDATLAQQLMTQGCMPGYAHDAWEWDGASLKPLTQVAFGGLEPQREVYLGSLVTRQMPVYRQVSGTLPATGALPTDSLAGSSQTHLWPWRYDASDGHFPLRSALARAYGASGSKAPARKDAGSSVLPGSAPPPNFSSPLFGTNAVPQLAFDATSGRILIFAPGGRVFDTDLQTWIDRTPSASPFDSGTNDSFAATWDSGRQRIVLFDPRTGLTWEGTESGAWSKVTTAVSPGIWSIDSTIRSSRDWDATVMLELPKMSYDRSRARTTMLYRGALWEYDGVASAWAQRSLPATLTGCNGATMMTFDGARNHTVFVGCTVPGATWEWDGSAWSGPFAGPFSAAIPRGADNATIDSAHASTDPTSFWLGTMQLPWAHPNALFETASLGGVATSDADGSIKIWNGSTWTTGPKLKEGHLSDAARSIFLNGYSGYGLRIDLTYINDVDYAPNAFSLPMVEDSGGNRILAFRDGVTGLRELRLSDAPADRQWQVTYVGKREDLTLGGAFFDPEISGFQRIVHPHPFELLSPEHITMLARTNPASRTDWNGQPKTSHFWPEEYVHNLYWPFRLLSDPLTHRLRVLTHRGAVWEMGNESIQTKGGPCVSKNDCEQDFQCRQGVCCPSTCNGLCQTCIGSVPGTCETMAAGSACAPSKCSAGIITAAAECSASAQCAYTGASAACAGDLSCADAATCKTHCSTSADCRDPSQVCNSDGTACVPAGPVGCQDGILTSVNGSSAPCAGNLGCADANSCRTQCVSRLDCLDSVGMLCSSPTTCVRDGAATLAAARGVTPVKWSAPAARTPQQIADILVTLGYPRHVDGTVLVPGAYSSGIQLGFDPNVNTPLTGVRSCLYRVEACMVSTHKVDECVAATPRCEGLTPWLGDPAGLDCCPEACLEKYFIRRSSSNPRVALDEFLFSGCYPGLAAYLAQDSP